MGRFIKFFLIFLITLFLITSIIIVVLLIIGKSWEREFVTNINPDYLISEVDEFNESLDEKIANFVLSNQEVDFVTFSVQEAGVIIFDSIAEVLGENSFNLTNIYIEPSVGFWNVCARIDYIELERINFWLCAGFTKDDMETAQLYISDIYLQGFNIGIIFPNLITMINQGIADALVTVNENRFSGRYFENIELLKDSIVVKGVRM